ncbi:MAG: hypothetical protein ACLRMW_05400 [[Clostridium] symbiosum]
MDSDSIISTDKIKIRVKDYSAISVGGIILHQNSDIIKDIGFIKGLPALEDLTLEDTAVISLASCQDASSAL